MNSISDRLATSYKRLGLDTPEGHVMAVQEALDGFLKDLDIDKLVLCGRVAFGLARAPEVTDFVKYWGSESLELSDKDAEVPLIAANAMAAAVERDEHAALASLIMVVGGAGGLRATEFDVAPLDSYWSVLAAKQRAGISKPQAKALKPALKYSDVLEKIASAASENNLPAVYPDLRKVIEGSFKYCESANSSSAAQLNDVVRYLGKGQEQMDIHWWVLSEWCIWTDSPFGKMPEIDQAVCAARDLANLSTYSQYGIFPSQAMLSRALKMQGEDGGRALKDVVTGIALATRRSLLSSINNDSVSSNLLPMLLAIQESVEAEDAADWEPRFKRLSGVDPEKSISIVDFSHQLYLELILERLI